MHHALINDTWTALKDHLVFRFKLHGGAGEGVARARISCNTDPRARAHEIELPLGRRREFHFQFHGTAEGDVYVRGSLRRDAERHGDGSWHGGVFADIHYGHSGWHDDQHFEGYMVMANTPAHGGQPEPEPGPGAPPDCLSPSGDDAGGGAGDEAGMPVLAPASGAADGDLFPYVYVRKWPTIDAAVRRRCFIDFPATQASPPADTLYAALCAAVPLGRAALEALALRYIEGQAAYTPRFIGPLHRLPAPLWRFTDIAAATLALHRQPRVLLARICELLEVDCAADITMLLATPACRLAIDAAWHSYFALIVVLGYDYALLCELSHFLAAAHLLTFLYGADAVPQPAPDRALLGELAHASIVLPRPLFPLPAPAASPPCASPPPSEAGAIAAYAIGDLQMVRQRLLRYEAGHIAHIDNVVRGEKKETRRRRVHRQLDYEQQRSDDGSVLDNQASDERNNLLEEARKSVAEKTVGNNYDDFQTRYGPPTQATLTGSWTESITQGAHPGADDVTRFAREVLSRTVHRITRQVDQLRGSSTMSENEDTVTSTIDNSGQPHNLMGVYRWLNQVYEACVVNYGNRLMVEFTLRQPAQRLNTHAHRPDRDDDSALRLPTAPALFSFATIHIDSYAALAATYQVTDVEAPPPSRKSVSATLRAGEAKLLAVPPGYMVAVAEVNAIDMPAGAGVPQVLVGRHLLTPGVDMDARRTFGEDSTIAVAVGAQPVQAMSSPPAAPSELLVNVNLVCVPMPTTIDAWRIKTYHAIVSGYQRQRARYAADDARTRPHAPAHLRHIEQRELKRGCMRMLLQTAPGQAPGSAPPAGGAQLPRLLQFLEECFEWNEMSYSCYATGDDELPLAADSMAGADSQFDNFLQANLARVLLPVHPPHMMALLYYLSAGALWDGDNQLVPVNAADIAVVHEMKLAGMAAHGAGRRIGHAWEVRVPTAMQVLDGCRLPVCRHAGSGHPAPSETA